MINLPTLPIINLIRRFASSAQRANPHLSVSWAYGGGRPGGEVAEKKDEGEIAIQSKRGNTIKRNAEPENPAVHVTRPGNDVVKRQSELDVEEKNDGPAAAEQDGDAADGEKDDGAAAAPAEEKPEQNNVNDDNLAVPSTNGAHGKEKSKSPASKKTPTPKATPGAASKKRKATEGPAEEEKGAAAAGEESAAAEPPAKKARGRPKGTGNTKTTPKAASKATPKAAPKAAPKPAPKEAPAAEKKKPGRKPAAAKAKNDDATKEAPNGADTPKARGRPKGSGGVKKSTPAGKKATKAPAKAVKGTVGSRTRSTKK